MTNIHLQNNSSRQSPRPGFDVKKVSIAACLIFLITLFIYFPATQNDFVDLDDYHYVVLNKNIRNLDWDTAQWMLTSFHASNWHPLTWLSHAVDVSLFGLDPHLHHLTNILLHALNTLLVFILVIGLLGRTRGENLRSRADNGAQFRLVAGIVAALLFGLHPIHVESMALTLPAILILLDIYPLYRFRPQFIKNIPLLTEKVPFILFSLVSSVLTSAYRHAMKAAELGFYVPEDYLNLLSGQGEQEARP